MRIDVDQEHFPLAEVRYVK